MVFPSPVFTRCTSRVISVHGGELTGESGQLASPLYPNDYPVNAQYFWTITVPDGMYVHVLLRELDTELSRDEHCPFDFIKVSFYVETSR